MNSSDLFSMAEWHLTLLFWRQGELALRLRKQTL
jgi:hypothetical protein